MPLLSLYVDKEIYDKIIEYVKERVFPSENETILIALRFLIKAIEYCREKNIKYEECGDRVIEYITSKE